MRVDSLPTAQIDRLLRSGFIGAVAGAACFGLGVLTFEMYGAILFLVTPTVMGFVAGLAVNWRIPHRFVSVVLAAMTSVALVGAGLLVFAFEGVMCLLMALPPAMAGSLTGALFSLLITRRGHWRQRTLVLVALLMPCLLGAEAALVRYPILPVVSEIEIDASPETVWRHVIGFSEMPAPTETMFRSGIAYPVRARLEGTGVGAIRYCEFSTGPFVEPITVWEPGHRLAFDVIEQPEPMHELSPYKEIYAPHLHHGLNSRRGEFLLIALPDGTTRLRGTTWYQVNMGPQWYWRRWSDHVIHGIHRRVLEHIKTLSETAG